MRCVQFQFDVLGHYQQDGLLTFQTSHGIHDRVSRQTTNKTNIYIINGRAVSCNNPPLAG